MVYYNPNITGQCRDMTRVFSLLNWDTTLWKVHLQRELSISQLRGASTYRDPSKIGFKYPKRLITSYESINIYTHNTYNDFFLIMLCYEYYEWFWWVPFRYMALWHWVTFRVRLAHLGRGAPLKNFTSGSPDALGKLAGSMSKHLRQWALFQTSFRLF